MILRILILSVFVDFSIHRQIIYDSLGKGKSELENLEDSRSKLDHFFQLSSGLLPQDIKSLKDPVDARSEYELDITDNTSTANNSENIDTNDDTATADVKSENKAANDNTSYVNDSENKDITAESEIERSREKEGANREGKSFSFLDNSGDDDEASVESTGWQPRILVQSGTPGRQDQSGTPGMQARQDILPDEPAPADFLPGMVLPIQHRKETLQDIYVREKLPEIQRIIASGDEEEIARIIAESEDDPFTILPNNLKYSQLLAADLFFSFLTKMVTWFVMISLLLPALVPAFTIMSLGAELFALWLIPEIS